MVRESYNLENIIAITNKKILCFDSWDNPVQYSPKDYDPLTEVAEMRIKDDTVYLLMDNTPVHLWTHYYRTTEEKEQGYPRYIESGNPEILLDWIDSLNLTEKEEDVIDLVLTYDNIFDVFSDCTTEKEVKDTINWWMNWRW